MQPNARTFLRLSSLVLLWMSSTALINPNFTPVDLVKQSDVIIALEFKDVEVVKDKDGRNAAWAVGTVKKVLKGKFEPKEIRIDLLAGIVDADGNAVAKRINGGAKQSIMYIGSFAKDDEEAGKPAAEGEAKGFVHIGGHWIAASRSKDGTWGMEKSCDDEMLGTWSGGTDMLIRATNYVLADPEALLPVREGMEWSKESQIGKVEGKIHRAMAVDVTGRGKSDLFLAAEKGDRLFRWDGKALADVTAQSGLTSKSQAFAWGDFNGDGQLDLASWDGKQLTVFSQGAGGTFAGKVVDTGSALQDGCISLTMLDTGKPAGEGRIGLLVSTNGPPVVLTIPATGAANPPPLPAGEFSAKALGDPAESFVADFDDDGLPDVMQLCSNGARFYKGTKLGEFAAPVQTAIGTGLGRHGACIGDWDADGLLDIFTCAEERNHLWHNLGGGKFIDAIDLSGSVAYISKPGGIFAQTSDFNSTGRQGILMLYGTALSPQLFFNRGFRSFGLSRRLEAQMKTVPMINEAQQAGCLGDFSGDGAPALALALSDGAVWYFPRKVEDKPLGITVALSTASPNAGPVTVWVSRQNRAFGAAVVRAGEPGAFFGSQEPGPVTVNWRFPGGTKQQKEIILEESAKRLVIDKVTTKSGQ